MRSSIIFSMVLIILFLTACGSNSGDTRLDTKLQTGTKGLAIDLMKQGFQNEVYEEGKLYAAFELRNEGYYDIIRGILVPSLETDLMGIESYELPRAFRSSNDNIITFNLKGKTLIDPKGEKQVIRAVIKTRKIDDTRNKIVSNIIMTACYPYKTIFSGTLCIDTDPENVKIAKKTCSAKDITADSQGAPIAITKIQEKILPGSSPDNIRVELQITAENKDTGILIDPARYSDICLGKNSNTSDYNAIKVNYIEFSDYSYKDGEKSQLECSPNPMRKTDGGYFTRCTITESNSISKSRLTFDTPLIIELEYGYKSSVIAEVSILSNNNYEPNS